MKTGYTQKYSYIEQKKTAAISFGILNPDEIQRLSVCNLTSEKIYDEQSFLPQKNAINDPRMGVTNKDKLCHTCSGDMIDCPGHFGHIDLARPVYHPGLIETVRKILKCVCFNCSRLLISDINVAERIRKIPFPKQRFYHCLKAIEGQANRKCHENDDGGCGQRQPKIQKKSLSIIVEQFDPNDGRARPDMKQTLLAEDALKILKKISAVDQETMGIYSPENLIIRKLAVAPPPVRPSVAVGSNMKCEDDLTYSYQAILKHNNFLKSQIERGGNQTTINELTNCLQYFVCTLMDNQIAGQPVHRQKSGKPLRAIKERLKGKEGRLRGNLMGKRVDFSARSVITPDPSLALDQLGVPQKIALNITVPEIVTIHNMDEMRTLVANGPTVWPGAKYILRSDGKMIDLAMLANRSDAHLEIGYTVERHLKNDDYVCFNRQPSLHKMSVMGHRVKVLPFSTFRLNLSVTTPYNADFDGDEMNMFVPQSYETLAEVREIMAVPKQIVAPQSNKPCMGIVQDSLLGIMLFTQKDNFIPKDVVMNLVMHLSGEQAEFAMRQLPMPAVVKPKALWTGKQIMSLIIPKINIIRKGQKNAGSKLNYAPAEDKMVIIQKGELLAGEFTKAIVGSASGGIIHIIWKECGPNACRDFLTSAQNVVNSWLAEHGFTVGVEDTVTTEFVKEKIADTLREHKKKVESIISQSRDGTLKQQSGKDILESFEQQVNQTLNQARDKAGNFAYKELIKSNKIQNMVSAGSKGTHINISQIMGCVGQQNVEGQRIGFGFHYRSLPHFNKWDYGPESRGFVANNYITGLGAAEFFFHAMGGREGLIDTAVKTSETGYIQRRLVKALEDVMVRYDGTVRNSANQIVQFVYGEDGMAGEMIEDLRIDLSKLSDSQMQKKFGFFQSDNEIVEEQLKSILTADQLKNIQGCEILKTKLKDEYKQILNDREQLRREILKGGEDTIHLPINIPRLLFQCKQIFDFQAEIGQARSVKTDLNPTYVIDQVKALCDKLTIYPGRTKIRLDKFTQETVTNATSLAKIYFRQAFSCKKLILHDRLSTASFDWLIGEVRSRFIQSLAHAGEVVGSIAAHSIGEPATQMTLNTFHFAGVSSKNVTLGVPRLKEIINVAKNIKAPSMQIFLQQEFKTKEEAVMKVQSDIEFTTMADIVDRSQIFYDPNPKTTIISEDIPLVELYNEVTVATEIESINSPWLLRFELNQVKMQNKQVKIDFLEEKLSEHFNRPGERAMMQIQCSDENADKLVLRIRFQDFRDEEEDSAVELLKEFEDGLMNDLVLKGLSKIKKVFAKKYEEHEYDVRTGEHRISHDNWMLETDGVALQTILHQDMVDSRKTFSNDLIEIKDILGTEASRQALCQELRTVLSFYGIYINYRHIAILCDVMAQKGRLTSITRHGINRLDSGPLRKCSFEETVDILLEAAVHGEIDRLTGVTENVIMGQLAPIGTGSFDIVADAQAINENAKTNFIGDFIDDNEGTPVMIEEGQAMGGGLTPFVGDTPYMMGKTSEYGATPRAGMSFYEAAFSPGVNLYASPSYGSPNAYSSPLYGSPCSPTYGDKMKASPIYSSPIYQPMQANNRQSPMMKAFDVNSPNYSPTNPQAKQSPYLQDRAAIAQSRQHSPIYSPGSYNGVTPASPQYQSMGSQRLGAQGSAINSPAYSPSISAAQFSHRSPNYSPSNPVGGASGVSMPSAAAQFPNIKQKPNYSPSYSPSSAGFNKSPGYSKHIVNTPLSPGQGSPYGISPLPISTHSPKIASHLPQQQYIPPSSTIRTAYNPRSPVYKQEEESDDEKEQ